MYRFIIRTYPYHCTISYTHIPEPISKCSLSLSLLLGLYFVSSDLNLYIFPFSNGLNFS